MSMALREGAKGLGWTSPNPPVGAVLVRSGKVLSKGYHQKAGGPHAEIVALSRAADARGATLYLTLEPCCHLNKKTPPCVPAILKAGIRRVVIGSKDPNPQVAGRGIRLLKKAGLEVRVGVLGSKCQDLIRFFRHWLSHQEPYVILKAAISLDGKVALSNGRSRWITGPRARLRAHEMRAAVDGVLVGIGTVQQDDPRLTVRAEKKSSQPLRIVLDPHFKISEDAKILKEQGKASTVVVTQEKFLTTQKAKTLTRKKIEFMCPSYRSPYGFGIKGLLKKLGRLGIQSLLIEGGPGVWTRFIQKKQFQELCLFLAPKVLGADATAWLEPLELERLPASLVSNPPKIEALGEDLLLRYRV